MRSQINLGTNNRMTSKSITKTKTKTKNDKLGITNQISQNLQNKLLYWRPINSLRLCRPPTPSHRRSQSPNKVYKNTFH